jgi:hypothetical protein
MRVGAWLAYLSVADGRKHPELGWCSFPKAAELAAQLLLERGAVEDDDGAGGEERPGVPFARAEFLPTRLLRLDKEPNADALFS